MGTTDVEHLPESHEASGWNATGHQNGGRENKKPTLLTERIIINEHTHSVDVTGNATPP